MFAASMDLIRTNRDLRVDVARGLALWWIFTDHMPGNWIARFSLRNFQLCDATEVFVLLAGYAAGLAYGRTMERHGWLYAGADVVRRAWTLYVAHIFLFVVFTAQVAWSAAALDRSDYLDEIHIDVLGDAPYRAMLEALTLHYQPAYLNILPMYIALLLLFAAALPLLRRPRVLAALSFALYAGVRVFGWNLPSWTGGGWYFDPLAWQLLFMLGAILSFAPGRPIAHRRAMDAAAVAVVLAGAAIQGVDWVNPDLISRLPERVARTLMSVDKEGLHPFRLVSILALAWLVARIVPADAAWLRGRAGAPLALLGQHSLPVFCAGIALSFLGRLAMEFDDGWLAQLGVNLLGALALAAVGALAAWYDGKGRVSRENPAAARDRAAHGVALRPLPAATGTDNARRT